MSMADLIPPPFNNMETVPFLGIPSLIIRLIGIYYPLIPFTHKTSDNSNNFNDDLPNLGTNLEILEGREAYT